MPKAKQKRLGERLVTEFTELRDALRSGKPVDKLYTVRTVELDLRPKKFDAASIRAIRSSLGVSQAVFARLVGVSADLVASWEQGIRSASGPVCRLLELMEYDKDRWLRIFANKARDGSHRASR